MDPMGAMRLDHLSGHHQWPILLQTLFALLVKNSALCARDFRVKMWGTASPDDKFTGDLGNAIETPQIDGRRSDRFLAGKLSPGNFRLLRQYRPDPEAPAAGGRGRGAQSTTERNAGWSAPGLKAFEEPHLGRGAVRRATGAADPRHTRP
jgi:hypothetical protein